MSFHSPTPLDNELAQAKQTEIEAKAARYARLHPDDDVREASVGALRRALGRVRALVRRR